MKRFDLKKKLSVLLAALILMLSVGTVFAVTNIQDGDWIFEMPAQDEGVFYLSAYTGTSDQIRIPALCQSKPIVKINNDTFLNKSTLTYVEIPATIEAIGMNAFYGCSSLSEITIPASVKEIGPNAFYGCNSLEKLIFRGDSELKEIPQNTFNRCSSITTVALPEKLTSLGRNAFFGCTSLAAVTIGPYVTSIDTSAFKNCPNLTIFGWNDTYAQQFASENNITFISFGDYIYPTEPTEPAPTTPDEIPTEPEVTSPDQIPTEPSTPDTEPTETDPTKYPEGKTYLIGDADLSGKINIKDATLIQKYAADLSNLDRTQLFLANCNGEGGVNVKDATQIQKYCADFKNILFVGTEVEL